MSPDKSFISTRVNKSGDENESCQGTEGPGPAPLYEDKVESVSLIREVGGRSFDKVKEKGTGCGAAKIHACFHGGFNENGLAQK